MTKVTCEHSGIEFETIDKNDTTLRKILAAFNKLEDQIIEMREEIDELKSYYSGQFQEIAAIEDRLTKIEKRLTLKDNPALSIIDR